MILMERLFQFKAWHLFIIVAFLSLVTLHLSQLRLQNTDVFSNILGDKISYEQIESFINIQREHNWLVLVFSPIFLLLKTVFIAFFIHMILIFSNYDVSYKNIYKLSLISSFIFVFSSIVQVAILYMTDIDKIDQTTLEEALLSIINVLDYEINPLAKSALASINLFELIYVILIFLGIKYLTKETRKKVAVTTLIIWIVFTSFVVCIQSFLLLSTQ